jgi:hypothetical protein
MNRVLAFAAVAICIVILLTGCAESRDPVEGGIGVFHPSDWATPGSDQNHAAALGQEGLPNSAQRCSGCHGADYGEGADTDCFECHAVGAAPQGHPASGFVPPSGAEFHGQEVIDEGGTDRCGSCHAFEFDGQLDFNVGGWSQQACNVCHAGGRSGHPADSEWKYDPPSPQFHGAAAAGTGITGCADCHGADYLGGWTDVSCNNCHASSAIIAIHPDTWVGASATPGTHGYLISGEPGFMDTCRGCHGTDLQGGWSGQDCKPCHSF